MSEWSIENTEIFPCKTSGFSKKYILNKTLHMRLVVLYKYMNCTVDKATSTGTGHTILIILLRILLVYYY